MRFVFLDTGYVVAVETANDQYHAAAAPHWSQIRANAPLVLVTTSFVFTEIVTLLSARGRHGTAVNVGARLFESPTVRLIHVDRALFDEGWIYFQQHDDKRYSLTDCISFVVMQRMQITTAFSFDHHFRQAGFEIEP